MKMVKKIIKISSLLLATIIFLLLLIPIVFKKQIQALVKKEINKNLNAVVDFKDAKLSLFKNFPKATITVNGLTIAGKDFFANDTLLATDKVDVTAGLFSVLKGKDVKVYSFSLQNPRIHAIVNKFGKSNFDIVKSSGSGTSSIDTSASEFKLALKKYTISNGSIIYDNVPAATYLKLTGLKHSGSGNLMSEVFTLHTSTDAATAYFSQAGIPFLYDYKLDMGADVDIDLNNNKYSFKTDDILVNALKLSVEGFVRLIDGKHQEVDIKFNAPAGSFKEMYSMVPAAYTGDFEDVKANGKASFNGFVKGINGPGQLPAYDVALKIQDGTVQYPGLSGQIKNIDLDLHAFNKDGKPDNTVVDISRGHLELQNEPIDFHFLYSQPYSAQLIDAGLKGKINLADLSKVIKLEKGTQISGLIQADAYAKGPLQALQNMSGSFKAGGFFNIQNLSYSGPQSPQPLRNGNIKTVIQNNDGIADQTTIDVSSGHVELGGDALAFTLSLKKPVTEVQFSGIAKGKIDFEKWKQFMALPSGTSLSGGMNIDAGFAGSKKMVDNGEYDKINLSGNAAFNNVKYNSPEYPAGVVVTDAVLKFNSSSITLEKLEGNYLGTNFNGNGSLNKLLGYIFNKEILSGSMSLQADQVDLNKWMATDSNITANTTTPQASQSQPFTVPANMDITLNASAGKVVYDGVTYSNLSGTLKLNDEKTTFENIKADALDGQVVINGSYSTKINKAQPDISLTYDIKNMSVEKVFNAFVTAKSLMPIGKFLSGKLHSQLSLTGNLGGDMMPLLNSLTGNGNLLLIEGVLAKFAPLEKIATVLDVDRLKSISVKEIRNFIEFTNGKVLVKPFNVKIDSVEMEIGGFHGFDQSLDYNIKMKLPRSYMGSKGNALVNNLVASANAKGVPVKLSNIINLQLKLTGNINNPSLSVNLKEVAGDAMKDLEKQAEEFAKAKADSLKIKTKDSLIAVKNQAEQKAKEKLAEKGIDTTNINISNAKDTIIKRVTDTLKKKATDTLKKKIRKILGG